MKTKPTTYTDEFVQAEVDDLLRRLLADPKVVFLGELMEDKPYSMNRFGEWYGQTDQISGTIDRIKSILHTRAMAGGLKNGLNPAITKFHMINNFGYKDKTEQEVNVKADVTTRSPDDEKAMEEAARAYEKAKKPNKKNAQSR